MAKFEDRLWSELIDEHGAQLASIDQRLTPRKPCLSGKVTLVLSVLAAMIGSMVLALAGHSGSRGYAVTENQNGLVTITIHQLVGIHAANARLAELGARVTIAKVERGCSATGKTVRMNPSLVAEMLQIKNVASGFNGIRWIINSKVIPQGDTLGLSAELIKGASRRGKPTTEVAGGAVLYRGSAPLCAPPMDTLS